jgi:archaemetzincin
LNSDGHGKPLSKNLCRCFDPAGGEWENIDTPQPNEWLEDMLDKTPDQDFDGFVRSRPNIPNKSRNVIYLQPICDPIELTEPPFPAGPWPSWSLLESAVQRFYHPLQVRSLPAVPMDKLRPVPDHRASRGYGTQWHAAKVLDALERSRLPADAYCVLAVTMCDLYPRDEWNFVYGLARLTARVGVFSFVRHIPELDQGTPQWREATMLHASMKTMLHEIGHMFGMKHCTWFNCMMRGSNGAMVEHQPNYLHLCPVCLRKLHWSIGFDVPEHHSRMLELFQRYEENNEYFKRDCEFLRARLSALEDLRMPETENAKNSSGSRAAPDRGANSSRQNSGVRPTSRGSSTGAVMRESGQRIVSRRNNHSCASAGRRRQEEKIHVPNAIAATAPTQISGF